MVSFITLANYFFSISYEVGKDIDFLFQAYKKHALFYWVDAVILEIEEADNFINDARTLGYEVKVKYVQGIKKTDSFISYFEADKDGKKTKKNVRNFAAFFFSSHDFGLFGLAKDLAV